MVKVREIVNIHWPMINRPNETKMRPALVASIDDENVALLFSFTSMPIGNSIKLADQYLNPDRFLLVHISALVLKKQRVLVAQETLDLCLSRSKWNLNHFSSVDDNYKWLLADT